MQPSFHRFWASKSAADLIVLEYLFISCHGQQNALWYQFALVFFSDPKYLYGITMANEHASVIKTGCMQIHPSFLGFSRDLSFPNFLVYLLFKRSAKRPLVSVRTHSFSFFF
jgi:hypothetical protein